MFVLLLFLLCPGANTLNLSAESVFSPTLQPSCLNACIPDGMLGTLLLARNIVLPLLPRDGTHIPIHCLPRIYNINLFCDCAQLRTGSHRNNFPLAHPIAHPDFKCSKIFIARLHCSKKIIKAQWSSVGTVFGILASRAIDWYYMGPIGGGGVRGGSEFFGPPLEKFTGPLLRNLKYIIGILSSSPVDWHPF